jgi:hypothetical protein
MTPEKSVEPVSAIAPPLPSLEKTASDGTAVAFPVVVFTEVSTTDFSNRVPAELSTTELEAVG